MIDEIIEENSSVMPKTTNYMLQVLILNLKIWLTEFHHKSEYDTIHCSVWQPII